METKVKFIEMMSRLLDTDNIYYEMIPEDNKIFPAFAYIFDDQQSTSEIKGSPQNQLILVSFDIATKSVDDLDAIQCKLLSLSGKRNRWFQLVQVVSQADGGTNIETQGDIVTALASITLYS
ncbi:hypothetical protein [Serratia phage vB_SmaS_Opt-169]|nr:hypothetical protein [Serratia phage vB_SmaS_Opt-169]